MQRFVIRPAAEQAYVRHALFAVELLDGVTMARVSNGVHVVAHGLRGRPTVNASGLFVWRREEIAALQKVTIDTGTLPYESVEVDRADLRLPPLPTPLTRIQLSPRSNYAFPTGITGMRGTLIVDRVAPFVPIAKATVRLRWLDEDEVTWHDSPARSVTNAKGDFAVIMRLAATEVPHVEPGGEVTIRLVVRRDGNERSANAVKLVQGRVADPTALNAMTFAWDELQP